MIEYAQLIQALISRFLNLRDRFDRVTAVGFLACSDTLNMHSTICLLYRRTETTTPNWPIWKPSSKLSKKKSSSRLVHPIICRSSSDSFSVCSWMHLWTTVLRIPSCLLLFRPVDPRMASCPHNHQRTGTAQVRHDEMHISQVHSTCCIELVAIVSEPTTFTVACLGPSPPYLQTNQAAAVGVIIQAFLLPRVYYNHSDDTPSLMKSAHPRSLGLAQMSR